MVSSTTRAVDFPIDKLIISRTDTRGVIAFVNQVFEETSGYAGPELRNAPHKIVRHPDMPKAAFHIIWDNIKQGRPAGGFVKNKCKDGNYYWVFATISPLEGGYMSIRFRPQARHLKMVIPLYAAAVARERDQGISAADSAVLLDAELAKAGFRDYRTFMSAMLLVEMRDRDAAPGREENLLIGQLQTAIENWRSLGEDCQSIFQAYDVFDMHPLNMRIQAGHQKQAGVALGVIATNFATIAEEVNADLTELSKTMEDVANTMSNCLFLTGVRILLGEAHDALVGDGHPHAAERALIIQQTQVYQDKIAIGHAEVMDSLAAFTRAADLIKRQLSGLSVTRVMCAIEVAQMDSHGETSLSAILEELNLFQETARSRLGSIGTKLNEVTAHLTRAAQTRHAEIQLEDKRA